jgi:hypothetical protein
MDKKPNNKVFTIGTIIEGHMIRGEVIFSPSPEPGIMTELAAFDAERLVSSLVTEDIRAGRL